jgi:hypothetical protein
MYIKRVIFRRLEQPLVKPINQAMENLIFLVRFFHGFMSGAVYKKLSPSLSVPGPLSWPSTVMFVNNGCS